VKVVEMAGIGPISFAGMLLADLGAEVTRIERPAGSGFGWGTSPVLDRGRTPRQVDLKSAGGLEEVLGLVAGSDVLIEGFRPGVMERLGLGYAAVRAVNPRLVYCSISGYGQSGPRAQEAGHDINYQARTGLLSLAPGTTGSPSVPPTLAADIAGGSFPAVLNILLALRQRDLTGEGCHLDIAMADAMFTFAWFGLAEGFATGRFPGSQENMLAGGSPRYALYVTADDRFLAVGALEPKFWAAFCHGIGLPEALRSDADDPAAIRAAVAAAVRQRTANEWTAILEPLDCCATILSPLEEAVADPQFRERGLLDAMAVDRSGNRIPAAAVPIAPGLRRSLDEPRRVPELGEHTAEIVESAGAPAK
jgi:crotonobetainyl-CoA:carnitine CoA-transferase CaiB-like acyl-CoA transferase